MIRFRPEKADSVGIILHYECSFRCAHCLYACRPGLNESIENENYSRLLVALTEACPEASYHIGGGEPFLYMDRLLPVVSEIRRRGMFLEYVETNGFWIEKEEARNLLLDVKAAGCKRLLLSISPFHNAFLACCNNQKAYEMIIEVFGHQGIFPWHPGYYPFLEQVAPDRPVPFKEYSRHFSPAEMVDQFTGIIYLHPAGRASLTFAPFLKSYPGKVYFRKQCRPELSSPIHAHVDPYGHYLTGFCTGLQIGDQGAFQLKALFEEGIALKTYPILEILVSGHLGDLYQFAESMGFMEEPAGYISACHLCGHIRTWLYHQLTEEKKPIELAPRYFYEEMGRLWKMSPRQEERTS